MPLYPFVPAAGIGLNLLLGVFIDPMTWLMGAGWLGLGVVTFYALRALRDDEEPGQPVTEAESVNKPAGEPSE